METGNIVSCIVKFHPFKSYYVVWKPIVSKNTEISKKSFKSYYVVWKLFLLYYYYVVIINV